MILKWRNTISINLSLKCLVEVVILFLLFQVEELSIFFFSLLKTNFNNLLFCLFTISLIMLILTQPHWKTSDPYCIYIDRRKRVTRQWITRWLYSLDVSTRGFLRYIKKSWHSESLRSLIFVIPRAPESTPGF